MLHKLSFYGFGFGVFCLDEGGREVAADKRDRPSQPMVEENAPRAHHADDDIQHQPTGGIARTRGANLLVVENFLQASLFLLARIGAGGEEEVGLAGKNAF